MATSTPAHPAADPPYRDDADNIESTPLLVDEQPVGGPGEPDEEQGIGASLTTGEDGSDRSRKTFNYPLFHWVTLALSTAVVLGVFGYIVLWFIFGSGIGYHVPWSFEQTSGGILVWGLAAIAWAGANLYRHRRKRPQLSVILGMIVHGVLGYFFLGLAVESSDGLHDSPTSSCWGYRDECLAFARIFWYFLLLYVIVLFILFILHLILLVAYLTATYRTRAFSRTFSRWSEHGFSLPGGQISVEVSVRFLRQDAPPPRPIRGISPLSPPPPPAPVPVAPAAAPAPTPTAAPTATLISTD